LAAVAVSILALNVGNEEERKDPPSRFHKKTPKGAGEELLQGSIKVRLVSLWWELPPRLTFNSRI
jgi:hypothetical protein